jgi:hypothetical protein
VDQQSGIQLTATHNPLAWLLYLTKLTVKLDGVAQTQKWGSTFIPAAPGNHQLEISFRYLGSQRGLASEAVMVPDGGTVAVRYKMPSWMFAKGKLTVG